MKVLAALQSDAYVWSPDGKRLAYMTQDGVWVVEAPDFRQPSRLIRNGRGGGGSYPGRQLMWSPDGQKLAFADSRPGDSWSTIWMADADGSHVRDLLPPGAPFDSPGTRAVQITTWLSNREIAFMVHCGTGCVSIDKVEVGSGAYWSLGDFTLDGGLYWAPTKRQAIAETHLGGLGLLDGGRFESNSLESFSPEEHYLAVLQGCVYEAGKAQGERYHFDDWSPDGKQVLYTGQACEGADSPRPGGTLYRWEVDSGHRERILANASWAAWSPDGSKIAFLLFGEPHYDADKRLLGADFIPGKPFRIYLGILEAATKAMSVLLPLGSKLLGAENMDDWNMFHPVWAPDSKRLVIRNTQKDVVLIWVDGPRQQLLTEGMQLEAYCDATCTQWSPNGNWLALSLAGKVTNTEERGGLERFLPPVGKEDIALSDAEIIQHYFEHILAQGPQIYSPFLWEYIRALEEMGKVEMAEEQYRHAIEAVQHSEQWRGTRLETDLKQSYAEFLCGHGRKKEAEEWIPCPSSSARPQQEDLLRHKPALLPHRIAPWRNRAAQRQEASPQSPATTSPESPRFSSVYIVEAPEQAR